MISDVEIVITREIARVTRQGFGKPLIFATDADVDYADCRNLTDVVNAGFGATTDVYKMATAVFSQNPSPKLIAVYGVDIDPSGEQASCIVENYDGTTAFSVTADTLIGEDGNGVKVVFADTGSAGLSASYNAGTRTITINFGGFPTAAVAAIVGEVAAIPEFDAAVIAGTNFDATLDLQIEAELGGGYDDKPSGIGVKLAELITSHNDWYFLLSPERDVAEVRALAEFARGNVKLYFSSPDLSVGNIIALSKALVTNRAVLVYHHDSGTADDPWVDAAWVGRCAPTDPGSITWKFKQLDGVPSADVTTTEVYAMHDSFVNTYIGKLGVLQTSEGMTTSGEFIDITRGADWVEARMSERIHYLLFVSPKVPFDNRGIGMIKGEIEAVLQWATTRGVVAVDDDGVGMFEVRVPDRSETDPIDRANRYLQDVHFEFDLAGAIHTVRVQGVIRI